MEDPKWKQFERTIANIHQSFAPETTKVKYDDRIWGEASLRKRQIDISVRTSVQGSSVLVVIECKDTARPIDVAELGSFASLLEDVRANKGVLVSKSGFTRAALQFAHSKGIDTQIYGELDIPIGASLPAMSVNTDLHWRATFWGLPSDYCLPTLDVPELSILSSSGESLGRLLDLVKASWQSENVPHQTGETFHEIGSDLIVVHQGHRLPIKRLVCGVIQTIHRYFGPIPIERNGLRNAASGKPIFKRTESELVEITKLKDGKLPGWVEVDDRIKLSIQPVFTFTTTPEWRF